MKHIMRALILALVALSTANASTLSVNAINITGYGMYTTYPDNQQEPFYTTTANASVSYDTDDPSTASIYFNGGTAPYIRSASADVSMVLMDADDVCFSGTYTGGGTIQMEVSSSSPLFDDDNNPTPAWLTAQTFVSVTPAYHDELLFRGQNQPQQTHLLGLRTPLPTPEPSCLLMLPMGMLPLLKRNHIRMSRWILSLIDSAIQHMPSSSAR